MRAEKLFLLVTSVLIFTTTAACTAPSSREPTSGNSGQGQRTQNPASPAPPAEPPTSPPNEGSSQSIIDTVQIKGALTSRYGAKTPQQWGEKVTGVHRKLAANNQVVALTFDACGGPGGSGYDAKLISYLVQEQIPATLFINSRWIEANPETFKALSANPLFEIENHGKEHKPLSVNGKSAYGIAGTRSVGEVVDETLDNQLLIEKLTGRKPKLFRSGTAYYDEIAVQIVQELGMQTIGFNVLGDAGATFSAKQIEKQFTEVKPGSIVICHMNQPTKDTAAGIKLAVPELRRKGFSFVKLEDYPLE